MDQTKVGFGVSSPLGLRVDSQFRKWEFASLSPKLNGGINLCRPQKIWLLTRLGRFRHQCLRTVHVVTTNLVLCAISTLWECLVATNVSLLASFAPLAALGMAAP